MKLVKVTPPYGSPGQTSESKANWPPPRTDCATKSCRKWEINLLKTTTNFACPPELRGRLGRMRFVCEVRCNRTNPDQKFHNSYAVEINIGMFSLTLIAGSIALASSCSTNFCRTWQLLLLLPPPLFDDPTWAVVVAVGRAFPSFSLQFVVADFWEENSYYQWDTMAGPTAQTHFCTGVHAMGVRIFVLICIEGSVGFEEGFESKNSRKMERTH